METSDKVVNKLTENTLIPVSLVVTFCGGIVWLSALWYREEANSKSISEIRQQIKEDKILLREDFEKVNRKLDYLIERLPKK
jgi:hypothetical protein